MALYVIVGLVLAIWVGRIVLGLFARLLWLAVGPDALPMRLVAGWTAGTVGEDIDPRLVVYLVLLVFTAGLILGSADWSRRAPSPLAERGLCAGGLAPELARDAAACLSNEQTARLRTLSCAQQQDALQILTRIDRPDRAAYFDRAIQIATASPG